MPNWFVIRDGTEQGPLSSGQLRKFAQTGELRHDDLVRREDITKRVRAGSVKGLFDIEAAETGEQIEAAQQGSHPSDIPPVQHPADNTTALAAGSSTSSMPENASPSGTNTGVPIGRKRTSQRVLNESVQLAGTLGRDLLAAARFAKAKVESASTERLSLPKAYAALGAHVLAEVANGKPTEFSDLCEQIRNLDAEIHATGAEAEGSAKSNTFADRTKATARAAKNAAIRQRLESKRHELLTQLGRASFEQHGESAGPAEIIDRISEAEARIVALESEAERLETAAKGRLLTPKRLAIGSLATGCLLLFWLVGYFVGAGSRDSGVSDKRDVAGSAGHSQEATDVASRGRADLPTLDQFVTQVRESGESTSPKGLPIRVRDKYLLRQRLGEPTNVLNSYRDRKGTHEILDYACRDGRVILTVTYDLAGAWIYDVAIRRKW